VRSPLDDDTACECKEAESVEEEGEKGGEKGGEKAGEKDGEKASEIEDEDGKTGEIVKDEALREKIKKLREKKQKK